MWDLAPVLWEAGSGRQAAGALFSLGPEGCFSSLAPQWNHLMPGPTPFRICCNWSEVWPKHWDFFTDTFPPETNILLRLTFWPALPEGQSHRCKVLPSFVPKLFLRRFQTISDAVRFLKLRNQGKGKLDGGTILCLF